MLTCEEDELPRVASAVAKEAAPGGTALNPVAGGAFGTTCPCPLIAGSPGGAFCNGGALKGINALPMAGLAALPSILGVASLADVADLAAPPGTSEPSPPEIIPTTPALSLAQREHRPPSADRAKLPGPYAWAKHL